MPELKDMTLHQVIDFCAWQQVEALMRGTSLQVAVTHTANTILAWQRERAASQAAEGK